MDGQLAVSNAEAVRSAQPRTVPVVPRRLRLSGLEPFEIQSFDNQAA